MKNYNDIIAAAKARCEVMDKESAKATILRCVDHTSLNQADSEGSIAKFVKASSDLPLAAICVYPSMLEAAGLALGESEIALCAVCGAFPSGQTYLEVKLLEIALAIENGADEIDVVIDLGAILEGQYDKAKSELEAIKEEIGDEAILKVIIESGALANTDLIHKAAIVAMEAGANFVKTSTGKAPIGATPEAVATICNAIKYHFELTGEMVGIKIAGGISTFDDAMLYYAIVEQVLGCQWLKPSLFRVGSSKIAIQK